MKKALAMALGAMLVAGSAVPAVAKSQIDFSGFYRVLMLNNWNQEFATKEDKTNDGAYFLSHLQLDFGFHATDEVSVYWRLRAPNKRRWGTSENSEVMSRFYYGEVKQDWGTVSIGKLKDDYTDFGLASLGYAPNGSDGTGIFTNVLPFDFDSPTDGIRYANRWDNGFQLAAAFLRLSAEQRKIAGGYTEYMDYSKGVQEEEWFKKLKEGETSDLYAIEPAFFWDGGGASLGLHYLRDHVTAGVNEPAMKMFAINPAFVHSWGDFSTHFEGKAAWGKQDDFDGDSNKVNGYAFYLDFDYNYGPGNVNLAGWWAAGPSVDGGDNETMKGAVDFGTFAPLVVAYGANANDRNYGATNAIAAANDGNPSNPMANHWAIDLNGAHAFTDDLTLTYALAYLALNKVPEGKKKNIGVETDLGLQIQLLDNLQFSTIVGYLFAGDALKYNDDKVADTYSWYNTLTFSF